MRSFPLKVSGQRISDQQSWLTLYAMSPINVKPGMRGFILDRHKRFLSSGHWLIFTFRPLATILNAFWNMQTSKALQLSLKSTVDRTYLQWIPTAVAQCLLFLWGQTEAKSFSYLSLKNPEGSSQTWDLFSYCFILLTEPWSNLPLMNLHLALGTSGFHHWPNVIPSTNLLSHSLAEMGWFI